MKHPLPLLLLTIAGTGLACDRAPAEPTSAGGAVRSTAAARAPRLTWIVPAAWSTEKTADRGRYRGKYRVPAAGNDKHPADALVQLVGRAPTASLDTTLNRWRSSFEHVHPSTGKEQQLTAGNIRIRLVELAGTYKFPLGPPVGDEGRHAAHVLKTDWRGIGAGVRTPSGELFWFRLVGPDDTVGAARSAMMTMLESLRLAAAVE